MARPPSYSFCGSCQEASDYKRDLKPMFRHGSGILRRQSELTLRPISNAKSLHSLHTGLTFFPLPRSSSVPSNLSSLHHSRRRGGSVSTTDGKITPREARTLSVSFQPDVMIATAAAENDVCELHSLLDKSETDVNYQSASGFTALHHAAANGCAEALELLLDYEANVNLADKQGNTAFDFAVRNSFFDCASILIKRGARADGMLNGGLHW